MINKDLEKEGWNELVTNSEIGIALFASDDLNPVYENAVFSAWFPSDQSPDKLTERIPTLKIERLQKRLSRGSSYSFEYETKANNRSKVLKLHFSRSATEHIFVKAVDYSREKEQEYLLDSYVKMAEKNKRELEKSLELIRRQKEELIRTNAALERERNSIELRALQAIINPHFVSNCLASIQRFIVDNEIETSVNYLSRFGKLMRLSFEQSYYDYIPIVDILNLLKTYVAIEKIRIDHQWEFELLIDERLDVENCKIPPLLIQPFLENSIWHGINHKKEGGKITIELELIDEVTLKCTVEDNGLGRQNSDTNKKNQKAALHSLNVTGKRLDILWEEYDRHHQILYTDLKTEEGNPKGVRVELMIPVNF